MSCSAESRWLCRGCQHCFSPTQQIPSGGGHPDAIVITSIPRAIAVFLVSHLIPQQSWINCGSNSRQCEVTEPWADSHSRPLAADRCERCWTWSSRFKTLISSVENSKSSFLNHTFSPSVVTCWNCFDSLTIPPTPPSPSSSSSLSPNHTFHIHSYISSKWNGRAASAESAFESVKCFHCVSPFPHCMAMNKLL